ncbi:MAG: hypothetical protein ACLVLH_23370 [Eisenbergiella massiliensis]
MHVFLYHFGAVLGSKVILTVISGKKYCCFFPILLTACTSLIAVWFGFRKKSATTVIISALILTAPMTNFASAGMYGWMSLAGFAAVMGALYFIVYRSLSRKVSLMEVL